VVTFLRRRNVSSRNSEAEFKALVSMLRRLPEWRLRALEFSRITPAGPLQKVNFRAVLFRNRMVYSCGLPEKTFGARHPWHRLLKQQGYRKGLRYARPTPQGAESEWLRVSSSFLAGRVPTVDRRSPRPRPPIKRGRSSIPQREGWRFLEFVQGKGAGAWRPELLFVLKDVRAGSPSWQPFFEGYWEPKDRDRKGFEIGMTLLVRPRLSFKAFERQIRAGFVGRMDAEFRSMGFDTPQRSPLNQAQLQEKWTLGYVTSYYKNVLEPRRFERESRELLRWTPR
jgi:hypothetical protein